MELYERRHFWSIGIKFFFKFNLWALLLAAVLFVTGCSMEKQREANAFSDVKSFAERLYVEHPSLTNLNTYCREGFTVKSAEYLFDGGIHLWVKSDAWTFNGDFTKTSSSIVGSPNAYWTFSGETKLSIDTLMKLLALFVVEFWAAYTFYRNFLSKQFS